jgi:hypothetical protein
MLIELTTRSALPVFSIEKATVEPGAEISIVPKEYGPLPEAIEVFILFTFISGSPDVEGFTGAVPPEADGSSPPHDSSNILREISAKRSFLIIIIPLN